jgi:predicted DNA-binding transcriptional regulator AlpA
MFREDVAVPKSPEHEGSPRLITIGQIAEEHGVSRSSVHTYRRSATFPQPVPAEGSTRIRYRADEVAAWFEANPKRQGKRTDLTPEADQGESMAAVAQDENESVNDADWRVPLKYTRQDFAALLASTEAGQYARMSIADYPSGGDAYVIVQGRGQSIRFNRLRVVDDPQYARDLAAVLLAWADREEAEE